MSGSDPWGDLQYLLMLKQRDNAYAALTDPFDPKDLLAPCHLMNSGPIAEDELDRIAKTCRNAEIIWYDIHQTFVDIVGYAFEPDDLDPQHKEEYWRRFGRRDDHIKRLKSISIHASALAKLLSAEPSAVNLHTGAGGSDLYPGLASEIEYIQRMADQAAGYATPRKIGEVRDDEYYRVSAVRRLIWEPVFRLYHRRFGRLPKHRNSKAIRAITLLHDIIGIPAPSVDSLLDAQTSFKGG